ncbi:MAG TPA: MFS transporter [Gaiellaceae bacterium]|nr:MFS transporter [Gaiellaceae bacterium]
MAQAEEERDYEPLDRAQVGGAETPAASAASSPAVARLLRMPLPAVFEPLRIRDFRLYWIGQSVSMVGDGVYTVAIAWQVYALSNVPTALAVVGIAQTIPLVVFVLIGGALADRLDRRRLMIVGAAIPGSAIAVLAVLAYSGGLALWHIWVISGAVGLGRAVFGPASGAFVPDVVPADALVQANSLAQLVRPLASTLLGPAVGGILVAGVGTATCFAIDAASFGAGVGTLLLIPSRPVVRSEGTKILEDIREGFAFIRRRMWIWGTLGMATVWVVVLLGPLDVLVPYIVKNDLGGGAGSLGLVYACGGIGAIVAAAVTGQLGLPRRPVTWMLLGWSSGCATVTGIAASQSAWQAAVAFLGFNVLLTFSEIVWITLLQRFVPKELLGRVRSLDWLLSVGLVPISFALTGPIADALGARTTLAGSALIAATIALATLLLPGMRRSEATLAD